MRLWFMCVPGSSSTCVCDGWRWKCWKSRSLDPFRLRFESNLDLFKPLRCASPT